MTPETPPRQPPVFIVAGPTASGKTALAHALAAERGLEIVSADSMQIYKGLPISTAAPSREEVERFNYRLVGVEEPDRRFSAGRFVAGALEAARPLAAEGRPAVIAGGTGFYVHALLGGIIEHGPPGAEAERAVEEILARQGPEGVREELERLDPAAAAKIHPNNSYRNGRALAVCLDSGRPISAMWAEQKKAEPPALAALYFVLVRERADLVERVALRTRLMWEEGVAAEAEALRQKLISLGLEPGTAPAARTLGLDLIMEGLAEGSVLPGDRPPAGEPLPKRLEPFVERMAERTRQYAKRQMTWLRGHAASALWLDATRLGERGVADKALDAMEAWFRRFGPPNG